MLLRHENFFLMKKKNNKMQLFSMEKKLHSLIWHKFLKVVGYLKKVKPSLLNTFLIERNVRMNLLFFRNICRNKQHIQSICGKVKNLKKVPSVPLKQLCLEFSNSPKHFLLFWIASN